MVTISASGVAAIALANIGFVLLGTGLSKVFPPSPDDLVKMLKNDLAHLASQSWRTVILEFFVDVECLRVQPVLALRFSLLRVHMHRLVTLVRIEVKTPTLDIENCGINSY